MCWTWQEILGYASVDSTRSRSPLNMRWEVILPVLLGITWGSHSGEERMSSVIFQDTQVAFNQSAVNAKLHKSLKITVILMSQLCVFPDGNRFSQDSLRFLKILWTIVDETCKLFWDFTLWNITPKMLRYWVAAFIYLFKVGFEPNIKYNAQKQDKI